MRIGELADRAGVTTKTIRFYEGIGVLPEPGRTSSGYRAYDDSALRRLEFVRAAQAAGLSLAEINGVLDVRDRGMPPCMHVSELVDAKLEDIDVRIDALRQTKATLEELAERARVLDPAECGSEDICHIITTN